MLSKTPVYVAGFDRRRPPDRRLVHVDDLVEQLQAHDSAVFARRRLRRVDALHQHREEDVADERRLARAGYAGDGNEVAERDRDVDVAQVVLSGALDLEHLTGQRPPRLRHRDLFATAQVPPGDRPLDLADPGDWSAVDDLSAVLTGSRPDVDHPVALANRLLVVLDDDDGVAEVAQPGQRVDEPPVVALVQSDRGFVEHVQGADETGTDLTGEAYALGLATGERPGRPRQCQVVEPDVEEEAEPGVDLLGDPLGDHPVALGELELGEELGAVDDRQLADLGDVAPADGDGQRRRLEPRTVARGARDLSHVALVLFPRPLALRSLVAPFDPRDHALVVGRVLALAAVAVAVLDGDLAAGAVEDDLLLLGGELRPGRVEVDVVGVGDGLQHAREVLRLRRSPRRDRPGVDRHIGVGDDELGIDLERRAQPVARLTGAVRRVEGEVAWRRLVVAAAAFRARQVLGERHRVVLGVIGSNDLDLGDAVGEAQRGLQRVGEAPLETFALHQPVDDDFDLVLFVASQARVALEELVDDDDLPVDPGADIALTGEVLEQRVVLALAPSHDGGEHLEARALGEQQDAVDDLLRRLALEVGAVERAVLLADSGEQQSQVVVHLGDRSDGRARVATGGLLVDRDRRRQAVDDVDVGLVHLPKELPGVRRQRFDVATLALGVDRVERQRRFARPGEPGEHDQLVTGQLDVDVLEVVLARTSDDDLRGVRRRLRSNVAGGPRGHQRTTLAANITGVV